MQPARTVYAYVRHRGPTRVIVLAERPPRSGDLELEESAVEPESAGRLRLVRRSWRRSAALRALRPDQPSDSLPHRRVADRAPVGVLDAQVVVRIPTAEASLIDSAPMEIALLSAASLRAVYSSGHGVRGVDLALRHFQVGTQPGRALLGCT